MTAVGDAVRRFLPEVDARNWVYPKAIDGRFSRFRAAFSVLLFAVLFLTPFVRVNGMPAILFDIPHRRFVVLGNVYWPHDLWLLIFIGLAVALGIFLFTALFGRVWCGYACPQSVFLTQIFLRIERWIEGDRNAQMKLDRGPWTLERVLKKGVKHLLFLGVASLVAHTFLAYFMDVRDLSYAIVHPSWAYRTPILFATAFTGLFYLDFAFFREQFCNYLCPYARFQSALIDEESLIVAYDPNRGEPRATIGERRQSEVAHGDCIDCHKCVLVCPQGIDIRDGLQLECIHCAACIDACDGVMERIGKPRGLIRYASEKELEAPGTPRTRVFRPRTAVYALLLAAVLGGLLYQLANRRLVEATLVRPAGEPFTTTAAGDVANHFRIQLVNKDLDPVEVVLELVGPEGWRLVTPHNPVHVAAGDLRSVELFITAPQGTDDPDGRHPFRLRAVAGESERLELRAEMILPQGHSPAADQDPGP